MKTTNPCIRLHEKRVDVFWDRSHVFKVHVHKTHIHFISLLVSLFCSKLLGKFEMKVLIKKLRFCF